MDPNYAYIIIKKCMNYSIIAVIIGIKLSKTIIRA